MVELTPHRTTPSEDTPMMRLKLAVARLIQNGQGRGTSPWYVW